ncbi:ImmA/IrrE family metallo-endopeptidase [Mesobacillus zeae]|uniref:ImmA/IrrE family metallo-endopeptidase n=1 Tax=Mesobacillus zeae TaxID=1917180 RepID=A0A398B8A2_9BACI|nr:ImmA/IrrE family metallo-endopeptidase [Mesobacillus zeae]RID85058.1 ImmA/IrrE family metallo-endopeptidase [Mesobacillus zeae]
MRYHTTLLEDWIQNFYFNIGVFHPHQLDIEDIIHRVGYSLTYRNISSRFYNDEVIIDERLTPQQQWQEFAHELCHAERHSGNQLIMPQQFIELQEYQANLFAYHFCVPTFMLRNIVLPSNRKEAALLISGTFNVEFKFAVFRLRIYERQHRFEMISGCRY